MPIYHARMRMARGTGREIYKEMGLTNQAIVEHKKQFFIYFWEKMEKMVLKNKYQFSCTSAIGWAFRIALQDPALYLDLYREAGFCLYRLNTAFSLRVGNDFFGIFVDLCQLKVVVLVWYGTTTGTVISITKAENGRKVGLLWGA